MDINTNYGMTNYQIGFQAKGNKKVVKTLADKIKGRNVIQINQQYRRMTSLERLNKLNNQYFNGQIRADKYLKKILNLLNNIM